MIKKAKSDDSYNRVRLLLLLIIITIIKDIEVWTEFMLDMYWRWLDIEKRCKSTMQIHTA